MRTNKIIILLSFVVWAYGCVQKVELKGGPPCAPGYVPCNAKTCIKPQAFCPPLPKPDARPDAKYEPITCLEKKPCPSDEKCLVYSMTAGICSRACTKNESCISTNEIKQICGLEWASTQGKVKDFFPLAKGEKTITQLRELASLGKGQCVCDAWKNPKCANWQCPLDILDKSGEKIDLSLLKESSKCRVINGQAKVRALFFSFHPDCGLYCKQETIECPTNKCNEAQTACEAASSATICEKYKCADNYQNIYCDKQASPAIKSAAIAVYGDISCPRICLTRQLQACGAAGCEADGIWPACK